MFRLAPIGSTVPGRASTPILPLALAVLGLTLVPPARASAQYALDAPPAIACVAPESPMVRRMRRTRDVGWISAGAGVPILVSAFPAEQPWMIGLGSAMVGGGSIAAMWAGSMLRKRCREVDAFAVRYGRRARLAGGLLVAGGSGLFVAGLLVIGAQPFDSDDDGAFLNGILGTVGFILPALMLGGAGVALLVMGKRRREHWPRRTHAFLGPTSLTIRTTW